MLILKKLIFAIPFLLSFAFFCTQTSPFMQNPNNVLSLDLEVLKQIIFLIFSLLLTGFFFVTFATLANDWRFVALVSLLVSSSTMLFLPGQTGIILTTGSFLVFSIAYFFLSRKLKGYLTFQASSIVVPAIKQTVTLLILVLSVAFYFQSSTELQTKGFTLPSSLIDTALKFVPTPNLPTGENLSLPQISPDLLKQYSLDPKILDSVKNQGKQNQPLSTQDLVKPIIESQFQALIKPIQNFIPIILAILFYFTISTMASLLGILLPLFTWFLFWVLEKMEFVKFEVEQREVKKMVV